MRKIIADKIASVTSGLGLQHDLRVGDEIDCKEGDVIAVRILNEKRQYNTVELSSGRFAQIRQGDILVGALGFRNALFGYAGTLPTSLKVGETINVLNLGGVLGHCTGYSEAVGPPFEAEVLGQVLSFPNIASRVGKPANIQAALPPLSKTLGAIDAPVVTVLGTSMNAGKTEACLSLIREFARRGKKVVAAKTTGVSLRRDVLGMLDAGAAAVRIFTDYGVVTTSRETAGELTVTILNDLASYKPDVIVLELGDGLMGDYGVDAILAHPQLVPALNHLVLAASDPVAAWGGVEILKHRYGLFPHVITGPASDNVAGLKILEAQLQKRAINARSHPSELAELILEKLEAVLV